MPSAGDATDEPVDDISGIPLQPPTPRSEPPRTTSQTVRLHRIAGLLQKPPTFSGQGPKKYDDYEVWSVKIKSYMTTIDDQFSLLMGEAEKSEVLITTESYQPTTGKTTQEMKDMGHDLREMLLSYTSGAAQDLLMNKLETTNDGFELWRLLSKDFKARARDRARLLLREIMEYQFGNDYNVYEEKLAAWEALVAKYDRLATSPIAEEMKVSIVLSTLSGPLSDHLTLQAEAYEDYRSIREAVIHWFKTKRDANMDAHNTMAPLFGSKGGKQNYPYGQQHYGGSYGGQQHYDQHRHYHQPWKGNRKGKTKGKGKQKGGWRLRRKGKGKGKGKRKGSYYSSGKHYGGKGKQNYQQNQSHYDRVRQWQGNGNYQWKSSRKGYNWRPGKGKGSYQQQQPMRQDQPQPMEIGALPTQQDQQQQPDYQDDDQWYEDDYLQEDDYGNLWEWTDATDDHYVNAIDYDWQDDDTWWQEDYWWEDDPYTSDSWNEGHYGQWESSAPAATAQTTAAQTQPTVGAVLPSQQDQSRRTTASEATSGRRVTIGNTTVHHVSALAPTSASSSTSNATTAAPTRPPGLPRGPPSYNWILPITLECSQTAEQHDYYYDDKFINYYDQGSLPDAMSDYCPDNRGLLSDTGACYFACPPDYANEHFYTQNDPETMAYLDSLGISAANSGKLQISGLRTVHYAGRNSQGQDYEFSITYVVCNVRFPIIATQVLTDQQGWTLQASQNKHTIWNQNDVEIPTEKRGTLWWICPDYFDLRKNKQTTYVDVRTLPLVATKVVAPLQPSERVDCWSLEFDTLVRKHYKDRKYVFNPATCGELPEGVHLDLLSNERTTLVHYEDGSKETIVDSWTVNEKRKKLQTWWTGETRFKLLLDPEEEKEATATNATEDVPVADVPMEPTTTTTTEQPKEDPVVEDISDYWIVLESQLLRVHVRQRNKLFVPGDKMPIPPSWLTGERITTGMTDQNLAFNEYDNYKTAEYHKTRAKWTGYTILELHPNARRDLDDYDDHNYDQDYWERSGAIWKRVHRVPRNQLYVPKELPHGPQLSELRPSRRTLLDNLDGDETKEEQILDNWRDVGPKVLPYNWTGTTIFHVDGQHYADGPPVEGLPARELRQPEEPTEEQRRRHELTHLPYRSWCKWCVLGKGRTTHAKKRKDRRPQVQIDYAFAPLESGKEKLTMLTGVSITDYMGFACIVKTKGVCKEALQALQSFLVESGRTNAVLLSDGEPAIKSLTTRACEMTPGLAQKHSPAYSSKTMGAVGNFQKTMYGQVRTIRSFLEEKTNTVIRLTHKLMHWILLYSVFLLNRFAIHDDGQTSYYRRWGKNYTGGLCCFGENVLFKPNRPPADKLGPKFEGGMYIGRCPETNECFVCNSSGRVLKTRTIRRVEPSSQFAVVDYMKALYQVPGDIYFRSNPGKKILRPLQPAAELGAPAAEPRQAEQQDLQHDDVEMVDDDDDAEGLPLEEAMLEDNEDTTAKRARQDGDDDYDDDEPANARRRVSTLYNNINYDNYDNTLCTLQLPYKNKAMTKTTINVTVNEELEDTSAMEDYTNDDDDIVDYEEEITAREARQADERELQALQEFDVYEEVPNEGQDYIATRFVRKRKSPTLVKSRLVAKNFKSSDTTYTSDDVYASTPSFSSLRILLVMALALGYSILTCDVSTAFLHALLPEEHRVYVMPPVEVFGAAYGFLWKLKRALYGLRISPNAWQNHFADVVAKLGLNRSMYDPNVYFTLGLLVLVHVDDLILLGEPKIVQQFILDLSKHLLLKTTGNLDLDGASLVFLGRRMTRAGNTIICQVEKPYFEALFALGGLRVGMKANSVPGTKTMGADEDALNRDEHANYRRIVGKLQWIVPLRPDIAFAVKELARDLASPTTHSLRKATYVLKYLLGTTNLHYVIRPELQLSGCNTLVNVDVYVDSDWAGCTNTRKSTSGIAVMLLGTCVLYASRTQETIALSSGEAELYAIGSGTAEGLFAINLLQELKLVKRAILSVYTDSTSGKSMATRFGASKKTRHLETRYLYMQELVRRGLLTVRKVPGNENPSDVGTKYVDYATLQRHLAKLGLEEHYTVFVLPQ